jgi:hypothetical protein
MDAPQIRRFYYEVQSSWPLAQVYRWKEDNICQSIWDKSGVIRRTCWGTHWELGEYIENLMGTHWELRGNMVGTHWEPGKNEKNPSRTANLKGRHLECMLGAFPLAA